MTLDTVRLVDMCTAVDAALGTAPHESMAQAAFRTVRLNIAPAHVQRVARIVLSMQGRSPAEQWAAVEQCVAVLDAAKKG